MLTYLSDLIKTARDSTLAGFERNRDPLLLPFKEDVLGVEVTNLKILAYRLPALDGLKGLVTTNALLTDEELRVIVLSVSEILESDISNEYIR